MQNFESSWIHFLSLPSSNYLQFVCFGKSLFRQLVGALFRISVKVASVSVMSECFVQVIIDINHELYFQFQAHANLFDRFSKGSIEPSFSVIRTFSAISVNVAIFNSAPFAPSQTFGQTKNPKI